MLRRTRTLASGKVWEGFYYNGRSENGKRIEIALGSNLNEAKRKWAELECAPAPIETGIMKMIFDRYEREIFPGKALSTQRDNRDSFKQLRIVFDAAPVDAITPQHIAQYRDKRTAKVRANREITLLSHVFNLAREWGYTAQENPCKGVRKNKEEPRDFYADPEIWNAVYGESCVELQDAMDVAYLSGQRPADVRKMMMTDIRDGALQVKQGKTKKFLRIILDQDGTRSELGLVIDRVMARPRKVRSLFLVATPTGEPLNKAMLRRRFDAARATAAEKAIAEGKIELGARIKLFQFRDIRPKAASEIGDSGDASKLLGHTKQQITQKVYRRIGESVKPTR
jgi:integrase